MVSLGMVAIDLRSRLADFLDDEELRLFLDYSLDCDLFMAGKNNEVVALTNHRCVSSWRDLDRLDAVGAPALTVKRKRS